MSRIESTFIVDGYNLMRQALSTPEMAGSLARAREALERKLLSFAGPPTSARHVILIYDGQSEVGGFDGRGSGSRGHDLPLEIRFARPPRSADDDIIDLAHALEGRGDLHVVSSDMQDIGRRLVGLKLRRWSSREFAEVLRDGGRRRPAPEDGGKPGPISAREVERWVSQFGFGEEPGEASKGSADDGEGRAGRGGEGRGRHA
jgi:predicted RNA-binding protein with PIN domain